MRTPIPVLLALTAIAGALGCGGLMEPDKAGNLVPRTVEEDPTLPAISINGTRLHAQTMGDSTRPVVIFLHGGPGGDYREMLPMANLANSYFLVFWDQRGTGLSRRVGKSELTLKTYDADLAAIADRYSPARPVFLVGVSWGGMFAAAFINEHPDRVAGAVLIEPGPLTGARFERLKNDITHLDFFSEWLNDFAWSNEFISADDHARMDYQRMLGLKGAQPRFHERKDADPDPVWRLGAAANRYIAEDGLDSRGKAIYDFTTSLSRFRKPVLFVTGALSEVLGESLQQVQIKDFPSASIVVVNEAGHDVNWVKPDVVSRVTRLYLAQREAEQ